MGASQGPGCCPGLPLEQLAHSIKQYYEQVFLLVWKDKVGYLISRQMSAGFLIAKI